MQDIDKLVQELFSDKEKFAAFLKSFVSKGEVPDTYKVGKDQEKLLMDEFMKALNTPSCRQYANDSKRFTDRALCKKE